MAQQEMILGYEQMAGANWSLGARFVAREFADVIETSAATGDVLPRGIDIHAGGVSWQPGQRYLRLGRRRWRRRLENYQWTARRWLPRGPAQVLRDRADRQKRFANNWTADSCTLVAVLWQLRGYVDSTIASPTAASPSSSTTRAGRQLVRPAAE